MIKHLQTKPLTKSVLRTTQLSQKEIKIRCKQIASSINLPNLNSKMVIKMHLFHNLKDKFKMSRVMKLINPLKWIN